MNYLWSSGMYIFKVFLDAAYTMDGGNLPLFPGVLSQMHEVSKDQMIIQTDGIVTGDSKSLGIEIT